MERNIDLPSYLAQRGYQTHPRSSGAAGITMANASTGDVVVVRRQLDADTWTYANPRDPGDQGTVSDFMMRRDRLTFAGVAERVIALSSAVPQDAEARRYRDFVRGGPADLQSARTDHLRAIQDERGAVAVMENLGIQKGTLDELRFGAVKSADAIAKVTSDPPGLWASTYRPSDVKLVFAEQPIDAMAYEKIRGKRTSCYMATGRQLTDEVKKKIAHVLCEIPHGITVVLAFGRDERGQQLAEQVRALAPTVRMERQAPDFGTRWSNQMQLEQRHTRSLGRSSQALVR